MKILAVAGELSGDAHGGALLTGVIGILFMPWKLTEDTHAYIQGWLVGYSGGLAPTPIRSRA